MNVAGTQSEPSEGLQSAHSHLQPLLSFAIPTWNRAGRLKKCVDLIAAQIPASAYPVEIVIIDNGSDDETPAVVAQLTEAYPFVRGFRNEQNLGFDRNVVEAFRQAKGSYIWLFSDDDFIAAGALDEILRVIRTAEPCQISTNYYTCDNDGAPLSEQAERPYMVEEDIANASLEQLFVVRGMRISFMSRLIFRADCLDTADYEAAIPDVRYLLPVYVVGHVAHNRTASYLSKCYAVGWRSNNSHIDPVVFLKKMPEIFSYVLSKFGASETARKAVIKGIGDYFITWKLYIKYRALGPEMSPLIIPRAYRFIPPIPTALVRFALRLKERTKPQIKP